jgi:hypothetical protein
MFSHDRERFPIRGWSGMKQEKLWFEVFHELAKHLDDSPQLVMRAAVRAASLRQIGSNDLPVHHNDRGVVTALEHWPARQWPPLRTTLAQK